jgi:beta-aspartyl-peptidase (threonine type)
MGTVGAVAMDSRGNLFAGTSTGGTCCKHAGRVGDSPLIGCGCYADAEAGGVSCTGLGEAIMRIVMAKTAVEFLRAGKSPQAAAEASTRVLLERGRGTGGLILLDKSGSPGFAFNTARMAFGYVETDGAFVVAP